MNGDLLSTDETRDLARLETIIARGIQPFLEVGEALAEIRDRKLYRSEHATFDTYLAAKWQISCSWAYRQIKAAGIAKMLPMGHKPTIERQVRPLAALPADQRAVAWQEAVRSSATGSPTGREVEAVVKRRTGEEPEGNRTPLQWLTYWWPLTSDEDRRLFDNYRAGMEGLR